ncbi:MAG: 4Fe-4S cluster-binding domain-containing protein [Methanosarcina sp.]|nr:4Fe-4S cluster-binding domain-containing protein [Methanosarcina sp.]
MNVAATQYSLQFKALEIYLSGCDGYCDVINKLFIKNGYDDAKCHNPELWDYSIGVDSMNLDLESKIQMFNKNIDYIFILGGEPLLHSDNELVSFLSRIFKYNKRIVLFTRFYEGQRDLSFISQYLYAIKYGAFNYALKSDNNIDTTLGVNITLASDNQKIKVINNV